MSKGVPKSSRSLVIAEGMRDANMFDVVRVSEQRLIGEGEIHGDGLPVQVYCVKYPDCGPGELWWNPQAYP